MSSLIETSFYMAELAKALGISEEILEEVPNSPWSSLYEHHHAAYKEHARPFQEAYTACLEELANKWATDWLRSAPVQPRRPFKPVRSASARKRKVQRRGQIEVVTWLNLKFRPLNIQGTIGRLSTSSPVQWQATNR